MGQGKQLPTVATVSATSLRVPDKARQHLEKAKAAAIGNRSVECAQEIRRALEIYPDYADAYLLRAIQEANARQYEAAIEDALAAQQRDPKVAWVGVVLAQAYSGQRRFRDALLVLDAVHGREAESWEVQYERTRAITGQGDVPNALLASEKMMRMMPPERIEGHLLRACALQVARRWTEAAAELELYLNSSQPQPQRAAVLATLEEIRKSGSEDEAVVALK